jgi:hypothetical protein
MLQVHDFGLPENREAAYLLASLETHRDLLMPRLIVQSWEGLDSSRTHEQLRLCCNEAAPGSILNDPDASGGESGVHDSASLHIAISQIIAGSHPITDTLMRRYIKTWTPVCRPHKFGMMVDVVFDPHDGKFDFRTHRIPNMGWFDPDHLRGILLRKFAEMTRDLITQAYIGTAFIDDYRLCFEYEMHEAELEGDLYPLPILDWSDEWVHLAGVYFMNQSSAEYSFETPYQESRMGIMRSTMLEVASIIGADLM